MTRIQVSLPPLVFPTLKQTPQSHTPQYECFECFHTDPIDQNKNETNNSLDKQQYDDNAGDTLKTSSRGHVYVAPAPAAAPGAAGAPGGAAAAENDSEQQILDGLSQLYSRRRAGQDYDAECHALLWEKIIKTSKRVKAIRAGKRDKHTFGMVLNTSSITDKKLESVPKHVPNNVKDRRTKLSIHDWTNERKEQNDKAATTSTRTTERSSRHSGRQRSLSPTSYFRKLLELCQQRTMQLKALAHTEYFCPNAKLEAKIRKIMPELIQESTIDAMDMDWEMDLKTHRSSRNSSSRTGKIQALRDVHPSLDIMQSPSPTFRAQLAMTRCYAEHDLAAKDLKERLFESLEIIDSQRDDHDLDMTTRLGRLSAFAFASAPELDTMMVTYLRTRHRYIQIMKRWQMYDLFFALLRGIASVGTPSREIITVCEHISELIDGSPPLRKGPNAVHRLLRTIDHHVYRTNPAVRSVVQNFARLNGLSTIDVHNAVREAGIDIVPEFLLPQQKHHQQTQQNRHQQQQQPQQDLLLLHETGEGDTETVLLDGVSLKAVDVNSRQWQRHIERIRIEKARMEHRQKVVAMHHQLTQNRRLQR